MLDLFISEGTRSKGVSLTQKIQNIRKKKWVGWRVHLQISLIMSIKIGSIPQNVPQTVSGKHRNAS